MSIQALILVKYPYFNEPGVEQQMGTAEGNEGARVGENGGYEQLRVATIQWAMIDQLRHPAAGFEQVPAAQACARSRARARAEPWLPRACAGHP